MLKKEYLDSLSNPFDTASYYSCRILNSTRLNDRVYKVMALVKVGRDSETELITAYYNVYYEDLCTQPLSSMVSHGIVLEGDTEGDSDKNSKVLVKAIEHYDNMQ